MDSNNRLWTYRGKLTGEDKILITTITNNNAVSARIFLTGEAREDYLGTIASGLLYAANEIVPEPLFVQTKDATVLMTRFNAEEVWRLLNPKFIEKLLDAEEERLGIKNVPLDEWDFYASMIASLQMQYGAVSTPYTEKKDLDSFYQAMYIGCLWLFGKGGYMAVPVSRHFTLSETVKFMKNDFKTRSLAESEMDELLTLREMHKDVKGLTNKELNFVMKLIETPEVK